VRKRRSHSTPRPEHVDLDDSLPQRRINLKNRARSDSSRAGHQDVDYAKPIGYVLDPLADVIGT
jgi:hypothetical protein